MRKRNGIIAGFLVLLVAGLAFSQPMPPMNDGPRRQQVRERVREIKMLKLMEVLQLSEDQSARFFPRYRDAEDKIDALNDEMEEVLNELSEASIDNSKKDIDALIERYSALVKQQVDVQLELVTSVADILSAKQRAGLIVFERRFQNRLRDLKHEWGGDVPPPGRHRRGGGGPSWDE